ncbi:MAG: glutamate 5-kinase [Clostridiales Family XIII bacterium]|jgi:glutamate 5-kinase|nr:glutamate 5-kinase [Clostridiales Family XIII bacterium]
MEKLAELISVSRKIVIKIGSNVLSDGDGLVDNETVRSIVAQVNFLMKNGKQVILVSSGAGICGVGAINKWNRREDINYRQALCAIGQVELMLAYKKCMMEYGLHVGQMLLTGEDFNDSNRNLNIRNTLFTLVDEGVVPIINENDSVSVEEIKIGDNDMLAANAAALWNADLLVLMSDIDGLFDKSPKENDDAKLIKEIYDIHGLVGSIDIGKKSEFGTGGIMTKISAAKLMNKYSIPTVLLNGKQKDILIRAMDEKVEATIFLGEAMHSSR